MENKLDLSLDRRDFLRAGLGSLAFVFFPTALKEKGLFDGGANTAAEPQITDRIRQETLFAGIRKPIKTRQELAPRIEVLKKACGDSISGPLTNIFRFDTPVDGFDSEIGYPVSDAVNEGEVITHKLRKMHFYSLLHEGPMDTLSETSGKLYQYMNRTGLSPELELVEVYENFTSDSTKNQKIQVMAAYLAWPEVYWDQLIRVLGEQKATEIWKEGETITPHTRVDTRCAWVAASIERLKKQTTEEQQFDILSRVALVRPKEDVLRYKKMYDETKDIRTIFEAKEKQLAQTPTGGFVDPPRFDGKVLHDSKVPYNKQKYKEAKTHEEKRKAYCFCNLVREASNPRIDPIFCYRAAGWARQFWEPILGVEFKKCQITHSILKGDDFCAWDYVLD